MKADTNTNTESGRELAPLAATPLGGTAVPDRVTIVPWGDVESTKGRFTVDEESGELALKAFEKHGCDLPVDYEHQTLGGAYTSPSGQAPAAGWIKRLEAQPGEGISAEIRWTEPAIAQLSARQYRYLSPVAIIRQKDRKLVALHSVALTNKPAITGLRAIVNREGAPDQEVLVRDELLHRLDLGQDTSEQDILAAANARLVALEKETRLREANDRAASAMAAGKLVSAQRTWAVNLYLTDEALFNEWLAGAPVVVEPGRLGEPPADGADHRAAAMVSRARAEYRAHPELAALTSEEAYVAGAARAHSGSPAVGTHD